MSICHLYALFGEVSFAHFLIGLFVFFGVEFCKCFIYFGYLPLLRCFSEYILPFYTLSFFFCQWFLLLCKTFSVWCSPIWLCFSFVCLAWGHISNKKNCYKQCLRFCCLCFLLWFLWLWVKHLSLWSILNLFLCVVHKGVPVPFFCMYLSRFPNTIYWINSL